MRIYNALDAVYGALKSEAALENAAVIRAYPDFLKPTRLEKTVIALSSGESDYIPAGIGESAQYGSVRVRAELFSPLALGGQALNSAAENTVRAVSKLYPDAIAVTPAEKSESLGCLYCRCVFTFGCLTDTETE
ncbi:MAG: hypothetical protein K6C14_00090 [Eubacterium sp.]|nr:hypothetical protein [Eubacterium sp.]